MAGWVFRVSAACLAVSFGLAASSAQAGSNSTRNVLMGIGAGIAAGALINALNNASRAPQPGSAPRQQRPQAQPRISSEEQAARRAAAEREAVERQAAIERQAAQKARTQDIQARLNFLSFDTGVADGNAGPKTRAAVRAFQSSLGMPATGELTEAQYVTLRAATSDTGNVAAHNSAPLETLQPLMVEQPGPAPALAPQPDMAILDMRVLDTPADIRAKLSRADFGGCRETGAAIICNSQTDTRSDMVVVGFTEGAEPRAYAVMREMRFKSPAPRSAVLERLRESYGALGDPDGLQLTSGDACRTQAGADVGESFDSLRRAIADGRGATTAASLARACDYHFSILIPPGPTVEQVSITLFAGQPLRNSGSVVSNTSAVHGVRF